MDRRGFVGWLLVLAWGCGDDVPSGGAESTSSSGGGETTFVSLGTTEASATEPTTTTVGTSVGPGTESTSDPDTSTSTGTTTMADPFDPFGPALEMPLTLAFDPLALALADFDGDGALDLLVTGTAGGVVAGATLLGDGDGGFGAPIDAGVTACSAFPIVGAIDDDDAADLFFGTCDDASVFYTAVGDGTFAPIDVLEPWSAPPVRSSRFVDHDADGDDDLVLLTVDDVGLAQLHLALDDGTLPWAVTTTDVALAGVPAFEPNGLGIAQIDGDERADVVLVDVDATAASMRSLLPVGHGDAVALPVDLVPSAVATEPAFGQGPRDGLVVASRSEGTVQVLRNADDEGLSADPVFDLGGVVPLEVAVGRFDADDVYEDLAVLDAAAPLVLVVEGRANGDLELGVVRELSSPAVRLLRGDLDDSAGPDLVAATFAADSITVLLSQ